MSENSELGLYYSWAYASAGISYAMKTGDDTYIKQSGMTEGDQKLLKVLLFWKKRVRVSIGRSQVTSCIGLNPIIPRKRVKNILGLIDYKCFMETSTCVTEKCMKFLRIPMVGERLFTPMEPLRRGILMVPGRWRGSLKVSLLILLESPLINSLLFVREKHSFTQ